MSTLHLHVIPASRAHDRKTHEQWQVIDHGVHVATLTEQDILDAADRIRAARGI